MKRQHQSTRRRPPYQRRASRRKRPWHRRRVPGGNLLVGVLLLVAVAFFNQAEGTWTRLTDSLWRNVASYSGKFPWPSANAHSISGRATVIDGDTIEIQGERIRLNGIDAPESAQLCRDGKGKEYRCGAEAAAKLADVLARSRPTTCAFVERDAYDRMVAVCYRADGANVAALMVSAGHALDWSRYSGGAYASEQQQAEEQKLGMWRGTFTEPWQWRSEQREQQAPSSNTPTILPGAKQTSNTGCQIKGNISDKGERIYHMPGQRYYDRTKISPAKGERMFCSEAEARAAGWRRSKL